MFGVRTDTTYIGAGWGTKCTSGGETLTVASAAERWQLAWLLRCGYFSVEATH